MPFPDGKHLLVLTASGISTVEGVQLYVADLENKIRGRLDCHPGKSQRARVAGTGEKHFIQPHHEWAD